MVARFATLTHFKVLGKKTVRVTFILKDGTHGTEQLRVEVCYFDMGIMSDMGMQ